MLISKIKIITRATYEFSKYTFETNVLQLSDCSFKFYYITIAIVVSCFVHIVYTGIYTKYQMKNFRDLLHFLTRLGENIQYSYEAD